MLEDSTSELGMSMNLSNIFEDPIDFEVMENAMITKCGHSFSDRTVRDWLKEHNHCPLCNEELLESELKPNYALRNAITRYSTMKEKMKRAGSSSPVVASPVLDRNSSGNLNPLVRQRTPPPSDQHHQFFTPIKKSGEITDLRVLVEVIKARDLRSPEWFVHHAAPYVVVTFGPQIKRSSIIRDHNPIWNEEFML